MIILFNNEFVKYGYSPEQIRVFIAQAAHETGFFTSDVFKSANNAYGIKEHKRKIPGKKTKGYKTYSAYESIEACIADFVDLIKRRAVDKTANNLYLYVGALKAAKYFEASVKEYANGMINAYKKLFPESANKYEFL